MNDKKILKIEVENEIRQLLADCPVISEDIDAVWVLSGPGTFFSPLDKGEAAYMRWMDRNRIFYGFAIVKEITAKKMKKNTKDITKDDIAERGPIFIYNGLPNENNALHTAITTSKLMLPEEKVIMVDNVVEDDRSIHVIQNTKDQIVSFPKELIFSVPAQIRNRIAIVSHAEHFPRILRYLKKYKTIPNSISLELFPMKLPENHSKEFSEEEAEKVWEYFLKGDLSWEPTPANNL